MRWVKKSTAFAVSVSFFFAEGEFPLMPPRNSVPPALHWFLLFSKCVGMMDTIDLNLSFTFKPWQFVNVETRSWLVIALVWTLDTCWHHHLNKFWDLNQWTRFSPVVLKFTVLAFPLFWHEKSDKREHHASWVTLRHKIAIMRPVSLKFTHHLSIVILRPISCPIST